MSDTFVFATNNAGKLREARQILQGATILSLIEAGVCAEAEEDGKTFEENALIKARAVWRLTGLSTLADDSGLAVAFLGGAPGVYSARYAGAHGDDRANNKMLLGALEGVPMEKRGAKFVCAAACIGRNGLEYSAIGEVEGFIAFEERGEGGFGYDPLFIEAATNARFSEMPAQAKNSLSHRQRAFAALFAKMGLAIGR